MTANPLPDARIPVLLSSHAEGLVAEDAAAILGHLDAHPEIADVRDVAQTVWRTRRLRRHRAVVRAADVAELRHALRGLADGTEDPLVVRATAGSAAAAATSGTPRVAFVFPGQGSQWPSMGTEAYARLADYRAEADDCVAAFAAAGALSPLDYLLADPGAHTNDFTQVQIQGAQFVHGVALARVWRAAGVVPDITVGHSLGEFGAAYVAGTITLPVAVGVVIARATLLDRLTGPYRVAVLGITAEEALDVIAHVPGWVELSVVNSRSSVAVSGDDAAVAAAVQAVTRRGAFAKEIEMWFPAHTTALDPMRAELDALLPAGDFADTAVQFIGSTTGEVVPAGTDFADYWFANLRSTVRFDRAVRAAVGHGARTFVEMSAHPALLFAMGDVIDELPDVAEGSITMVGSGRRGEPIVDRLSANVTAVALAEPGHRWSERFGEPRRPLRHFPFASMRTDHHWATPEPLPPVASITVAVDHWEPMPETPASGIRRVALIGADADERLGAVLQAAVERHPWLEPADPTDADLLVVVAPSLDTTDTAVAADELAAGLERGLLAYPDALTANSRDVWLVTAGGERVRPTEPVPRPAAAALAAMHRSVGLEHPELRFGHVDLPHGDLDAATGDAAVAAFFGDSDDVAVRAGVPHRRGLRERNLETRSWTRASGVLDDVVVTGGGGAIGMRYARALAERGAQRVVLLSRRGADTAALARLTETHGTEFLAPPCDLTDPVGLAVVAGEFAGGGASLVIHAAGVATIAPRRELTAAATRDTFAAKVIGLHHLVQSWPLRADARIVLCSSVSGLWGGRGHAAYSAANRLLDVTAARLRDTGRSCTSVRWGLWQDAGIIDAAEVARVERSGLIGMRPDRAIAESLRDHVGDPIVFSADPGRLRAFLGTDGGDGAERPTSDTDLDTGGLDATGTLRVALGAVLNLPDADAFELDASLLDLGVDSLLAIDLRKRLKKATGRNVPLATILGGATAAEVIEHLERPEKKAFSRD